MLELTSAERRALRARAHPLRPVVTIGQGGLTAAVLHEIDVNLLAHELIKIRVLSEDRVRREELMARICAEIDAAPVQHIGRLLVVFRPRPEEAEKPPPPNRANSSRVPGAGRVARRRSASSRGERPGDPVHRGRASGAGARRRLRNPDG